MKNDRHAETARMFGVVGKCEALEAELLSLPCVESVEFDLDGLYDNIWQAALLIGYKVPVMSARYFEEKKELVRNVVKTLLKHGLNSSGDTIEDYGAHLYLVRDCGPGWRDAKIISDAG